MQEKLVINNIEIGLGETKKIEINVGRLYSHTPMLLPVKVIRGQEAGPTLLLMAAIHGDELNGIEIIRRVLLNPVIKKLKGTLITVPIVNIFGVNFHSRYLPDRRDLNRVFPGNKAGSQASRLANTVITELLEKSDYAIDFHTGAVYRPNMPHLRISNIENKNKELEDLAMCFGVPVVLNTEPPEGSIRYEANKRNIPLIVFEGGEALRFNEKVIKSGATGTFFVMNKLGMISERIIKNKKKSQSFIAKKSFWVRAPKGGFLRIITKLGSAVEKGELIAIVTGPFGEEKEEIYAKRSGIIIGQLDMPLVNSGDAIFHIATFKDSEEVEETVEEFSEELERNIIEAKF